MKPECGGLFKYPKHAPVCSLNPANLKRPADASRASSAHHRAQEADDDDDSEADPHEADESYLPDSDGANSTELFFDARETPSKRHAGDARDGFDGPCCDSSINIDSPIHQLSSHARDPTARLLAIDHMPEHKFRKLIPAHLRDRIIYHRCDLA